VIAGLIPLPRLPFSTA